MSTVIKHPSHIPLIERMPAMVKVLICFAIACAVYFFVELRHADVLTHLMLGWDTFSLLLIIELWVTFFVVNSTQIRNQSKIQDPSRPVIFLIVLISTLASFLAVVLLLLTKERFKDTETFHLVIAIAGMILSWLLIHSTFTTRYAHIFYDDSVGTPDVHAEGLIFPGDDRPEYLDFAYFSFVLGMTFQVSDVQITSKRIRRLALLHGLLSFGYNTIMIALTINLIAGFGG